ncbi:MAG: hypothetical protein AB1414_01110 [bacterium]
MEKTFLVKTNRKEPIQVSEKVAAQLQAQRRGEVLGEVKDVKLKRGSEICSISEFRQKYISKEYLPDGRTIRKVAKGFEPVYELEKNSRPQVKLKKGAYSDKTVVSQGGTEIPFEQWLKMKGR